MRTTRMCGERIAAWTVAIVAHAVLAMLLLRVPAPLKRDVAEEGALEVVWIAAPRSQVRPARATGVIQERSSLRKGSQTQAVATHASALEVAQDPPFTSLSAVLAEQARQPASEAERAFNPDPFADRTARLPGRDARTFRMRPAPSLAERVAAVGRMFGGGDDPCRSARDSINELSQAGDSRVLQDALDFEKRHCR